MGKSVALRTLAVEAIRRDPNLRVLFVAPMISLVDQFVDETSKSIRVTKVDRFALRETIDREGSGALFKAPGIYALTLQFAMLPDVNAALRSVKWGLTICDGLNEMPEGTVMAELIDQLALASTRMVVASSPIRDVLGRTGEEVVRWNKGEVVDNAGNVVSPPQPSRVVLPYPVSEDLYRLLEKAREQGASFDGEEGTVAEALESSPAAAEMLALEQDALADQEKTRERTELARAVLRQIERLHADDKLNALLAYLQDRNFPEGGGRICVATRFIQTAYYLSSALVDVAPVELVVTSSDTLQTVSSGHAPIVVGGLHSLALKADLSAVDRLVFYDSGESPAAYRLIETANALGRTKPLTVAMLVPTPRDVDGGVLGFAEKA